MEIKSTANNWAFMPLKLHSPWWKCFEDNKWYFSFRLLQKQETKRVITGVNRINERWRKNFTALIRILWHVRQKKLKQLEKDGMNAEKNSGKSSFYQMKNNLQQWIQFSWHIPPFYRGENDFKNLYFMDARKKKKMQHWATVFTHNTTTYKK